MGFTVEQVSHDISGTVAFDFASADGRECTTYPGENKPEVIVYLGGGGDGRPGIADVDLLLDGDRRRDAVDALDIRFAHPAKELAGIRRKALGETALTLREKRIKGQRGLAGAGDAGHDHELAAWYLHGDVLEVVDLGPSDDDAAVVCHIPDDWNCKFTQNSYLCLNCCSS